MRSTRFHIVNLGCKVNRVEADAYRAALMARGASPAAEEAADLVIVNTCTVTAEADKKARKAVRHALAVNPVAQVLVTGCAAAIDAEVFRAMDPRVRVVGKRQIEDELLDAAALRPVRVGEGFHTRVGLKVQDGCDHACSYCIVHVARGPARSAPAKEVALEARRHFEAGVREIVLTGIDIGAYRDGETTLARLADVLLEEADRARVEGHLPARVRVSSIEPLSVDSALVEALARHDGRLCRHFHMPLQAGSEKVLSEMRRPYDVEGYLDIVRSLREQVPEIALSTDVIVGFPGETEEDFEATCDAVREAGFMRLHVFPYSRREGTPAAERPDQVPPEVKRERAARLRAIGAQLAEADFASRAGRTELCLVEDEIALTESYHEIPIPPGAALGDLVPVVL